MKRLNAIALLLAAILLAAGPSFAACNFTAPGSCVPQDDGVPKSTPTLGSAGVPGSLTMYGATSGYALLQPSAVAGSVTLTLPATAGTLINTAGGQSIAGLTVTGSLTDPGGTITGTRTYNYDGDWWIAGNTDASLYYIGGYAQAAGTLAGLATTTTGSTDFCHMYFNHNVPTPTGGTFTTTADYTSTSYSICWTDAGSEYVYQAPATGTPGAAPVFGSTPTYSLNLLTGSLKLNGNAVLYSGGALGTPSSGVGTNLTGLQGSAISGAIGGGTPAAGTFTVLTANTTFTATGLVTNADLATAAANTFKANNTGGVASPTDVTAAAAQQALLVQSAPQGRLTLTTGAPVMTATVTGGATIYYTPYIGRHVPLWNGTNFVMTDIGGELAQATTDTTKSPAAVAASSCYDMFVWSDAGTIRATRGVVWTNTTTRAAALVMQQGIWVNNVAVTNGPLQYYGTYVGTVCSNASSTIDWILTNTAAGGGVSSLNVLNMYNRVMATAYVGDTSTGHSYSTATIRAYNGGTAQRINFVSGLIEDVGLITAVTPVTFAAALASKTCLGIGLSSTSAYVNGAQGACGIAVVISTSTVLAFTNPLTPTIGQNYAQELEIGDGTNANPIGNASVAIPSLNLYFRM